MEASWPDFESSGPVVSNGDVAAFEQRFEVSLLDDYRDFLLKVNGGRPAHGKRRFAKGLVNALLCLNETDRSALDLVEWNERLTRDLRTTDVIIVGYDDGGGRILLAVKGEHRGEVWHQVLEERPEDANPRVLWHDRRDFSKLAGSFTEFIATLQLK